MTYSFIIEGMIGLGMDTVIAASVLFVVMLGTTIWYWMTPDKKTAWQTLKTGSTGSNPMVGQKLFGLL